VRIDAPSIASSAVVVPMAFEIYVVEIEPKDNRTRTFLALQKGIDAKERYAKRISVEGTWLGAIYRWRPLTFGIAGRS
jgi:hypothetical protein